MGFGAHLSARGRAGDAGIEQGCAGRRAARRSPGDGGETAGVGEGFGGGEKAEPQGGSGAADQDRKHRRGGRRQRGGAVDGEGETDAAVRRYCRAGSGEGRHQAEDDLPVRASGTGEKIRGAARGRHPVLWPAGHREDHAGQGDGGGGGRDVFQGFIGGHAEQMGR